MEDIVYMPCYSLTPSTLVLYEIPDKNFLSDKQRESFKNLENNENKYFELSSHSRKRLKKSIDFLLFTTKNKTLLGTKLLSKSISNEIQTEHGQTFKQKINYKLTFVTLTLSAPQHNTDEEIKNSLLNNFLTHARRTWSMDYYIWKAEKQQNGNIHFHILTNIFIPYRDIRKTWNKIQDKPGFDYVKTYSKNMKTFFANGFKMFPNDKRKKETQLKAYEINLKIGWTEPNSTDIHSLYKIKNISAYMTKYMAKSVTKTDRVLEMMNIYNELEPLKTELQKSNTAEIFEPDFETKYTNINDKIIELETKLEELKKQGVAGRIWGQSQNLSKIKPYSDIQTPDNIPDFQTVVNTSEYQTNFKTGNRTVSLFKFDINHTPQLKAILNKHIDTCLNEEIANFLD